MAGLRRMAVAGELQSQSSLNTFIAPIRGWIQSQNLATAAKKEGGASILENWFPTTRGIRLRGGTTRKATLPTRVYSLMVYRSGATQKLFGSTAAAIYNITSPADPLVTPAADITGQTSGFYSSTMSSTAGGDFLTVVNGTDARQVYDGAAWSTSPAITGVTSSTLSHVWTFKNKLFFIQKNTMKAWCLAADAIGGAATEISLKGVFTRGGSLYFGDTWSVDAGDGLDDMCVFVTTEGEAAMFSGTDPASASTWSLVSRFDIGKPLGQAAILKAGGDLVIATAGGFVPMSAAMRKDPSALALDAVSRNIEDEWKTQADARNSAFQWSVLKWPERNMAIVGLPYPSTGFVKACYVVNLLTGAWATFTGWDVSCSASMNGLAYFGTSTGSVQTAEVGGSDDGSPYASTYVGLYDHLKKPGIDKTAKMMRATFKFTRPFNPRLSCSFNYVPDLPAYPNAATHLATGSEWDVGLWDTALWDANVAEQLITRWVSVYGHGFTVAPNLQITNNHTLAPLCELVSMDLLYEDGAIVV